MEFDRVDIFRLLYYSIVAIFQWSLAFSEAGLRIAVQSYGEFPNRANFSATFNRVLTFGSEH